MESNTRAEAPRPQDRELVERIRRGDPAAFELLFRSYYDQLCTFAEGYLRSFSEAEDLVDDVFLRVWERRADWKLSASVKSYLYGSVRNAVIDRLKHRRVVDRVHNLVGREHSVPGAGQAAPASDERLESADLQVALQHAVDSLPERCRHTHLLRWRHGLTYAEIAEVMGVSIKTVENQLARALQLLRERLACWR